MERIPDDELIGAYLDDELSTEERARAERLLVERADLRRLLEELRSLREGLRSLPAYRLEEGFGAAVLRRAEKEILRPRPAATETSSPIVDAPNVSSPIANSPATDAPTSPVMPASVVASPESLSAQQSRSGIDGTGIDGTSFDGTGFDGTGSNRAGSPNGATFDRLGRWRRPAVWSIVAVAAALLLMFVPPRTADRQGEIAQSPGPAAPEAAIRDSELKPDVRDNAAGDARRPEGVNSDAYKSDADKSNERNALTLPTDTSLGDKPAGDAAGQRMRGFVAPNPNFAGTPPLGQVPVGQVTDTDPIAAKQALNPAADPNRPFKLTLPMDVPFTAQSLETEGTTAGDRWRFELDRQRVLQVVDSFRTLRETPAEQEQPAEPLQRRLAAVNAQNGGPGNDPILIVECVVRPGAIDRFTRTLDRNRVRDLSASDYGSVASTTSTYGGTVSGGTVSGGAAPAPTAPVPTAPVPTAPAPTMPIATTPAPVVQSKIGPAQAGDLAGTADQKKQIGGQAGQDLKAEAGRAFGQPAAELRESLAAGEEFYYVVADFDQLEGMLNEISSDRMNFISVRVEPSPQIEKQQAWNQYSFGAERSRSTADPAKLADSSASVRLHFGAPNPDVAKPALKTDAGVTAGIPMPAAAPAGPLPSTPLPAIPPSKAPAEAAPSLAGAAPPSAGRSPVPASATVGAPGATSAPARPELPGAFENAAGKEKAPAVSPTSQVQAGSAPAGGGGAMNRPIVNQPVPAPPASPAGGPASTPVATTMAPAAPSASPLVSPQGVANDYELRGLAVPQSRAQRFRYGDLSERQTPRGRGYDVGQSQQQAPAQPGMPLDGGAPARSAGETSRQGNAATSGGMGGGGGGLQPGGPPLPISLSGSSVTATAPKAAPAAAAPRAAAAATAAIAPPPAAGMPPATTSSNSALARKPEQSRATVTRDPATVPAPTSQAASTGYGVVMGRGAATDPVPSLNPVPSTNPASSTNPAPSVAGQAPALGVPGSSASGEERSRSSGVASSSGAGGMGNGTTQQTASPLAIGAGGPPTTPLAGPLAPLGALPSQATSYNDGRQAVADALRRSGGRQEALFIFRVAKEGEANSAYGDAVDVAKEQPAPASKPVAEPAAPTPKPPIGKGG